jgi:hypothetical protein
MHAAASPSMMGRRTVRRAPLTPSRLTGGVAVLFAGAACAGDGPSGIDGPEPAAIRAVAVSARDALVRTLRVELEAPMAVEVDYWTGAACTSSRPGA